MILRRIVSAVRRYVIMTNLKNFKPYEFECNCGCGLGIKDMDPDLLIRLDEARQVAGIQFVLTSAMRCRHHNDREGGSATSSHLIGHAVDIKARNDSERWSIIEALMVVGLNRIGITANGNIHVDNDPGKNSKVFWSKTS